LKNYVIIAALSHLKSGFAERRDDKTPGAAKDVALIVDALSVSNKDDSIRYIDIAQSDARRRRSYTVRWDQEVNLRGTHVDETRNEIAGWIEAGIVS